MIDSSTRDYVAVTQQELAGWVDRLTDVDTGAADGELIDQITELEKIKAACATAQAALTLAFHTSRTRGLSSTELRNEAPTAASTPRSPSPAATPPSAAAGTSAWPER